MATRSTNSIPIAWDFGGASRIARGPRSTIRQVGATALILGVGLVYLALQTYGYRIAESRPTRAVIHTHDGDQRAHVHVSESTSGSDGQAEARPVTVVRPLSCTPLPHVEGKSVTTAIVEFPPNAYTPAHRHPGSVTAYVLKGIIRSQMEGEAPQTYPEGATWFEAPRALHVFAANASATEPAELLAIFVADTNCGPLVILEPPIE